MDVNNEKSDTMTVHCIECGKKKFIFSYKTLKQMKQIIFTCPVCTALTQVDISNQNGFEALNVRNIL